MPRQVNPQTLPPLPPQGGNPEVAVPATLANMNTASFSPRAKHEKWIPVARPKPIYFWCGSGDSGIYFVAVSISADGPVLENQLSFPSSLRSHWIDLYRPTGK